MAICRGHPRREGLKVRPGRAKLIYNMQLPSKKAIIAFFILIVAVHVAGLSYQWYHKLWWIDIVMHASGGFWVAMVVAYGYQLVAPQSHVSMPRWLYFSSLLGIAMIIGVVWEWGEFVSDALFFPTRFVFRMQLGLTDTMGDLLADLVGAAAYLGGRIYTRHKA